MLTDSGGLARRSAVSGQARAGDARETERPEGLEAGTLELVGADPAEIVGGRAAAALTDAGGAYSAMARAANPYGDGHAAGASSLGSYGSCARVPDAVRELAGATAGRKRRIALGPRPELHYPKSREVMA